MSRIILALIFFAAPFLSLSASICHAEQQEVGIGLIVPLTGGLAENGQSVARLTELMEPQLNARQSKYRYRFFIEDGKCGVGNGAVSAANRLIHVEKLKFLITGCSGETLQTAPIAEKNKVLTVAILSNHQDVSKAGDYVFRNFSRNQQLVHLYVKMAKDHGALPLYVISEENAFTLAYKELLLAGLKGHIAGSADYAYDSEDFRAVLTRAKSARPKSLFLNCASPRTCAVLLTQTRNLGLEQRVYTNYFVGDPSFLASTGVAINNTFLVDLDEVKGSSAGYDELMNAYSLKYGRKPPIEIMTRAAFDAINMMAEGVETFGADTEKVKSFFYDYSGRGALGDIHYDSNGDIQGLGYVIKEIREGKVLTLE